MDAVQLQSVTKSYGDHQVLRGLDLTVRRGEVVALLGPNGAGKTTTVRIVCTLARPDGGTARVGGYDVVRDARRVRPLVGLTGQQVAVDGLLTGRENLVQVGRLRGLGRAAARHRAAELLDAFDLDDAADRRATTYSGGMRRRLDLAVGLVVVPSVLVLDEPTTGLDPRSRLALWDVVQEQAAAGVAVLLTTQYLEEADRLADRIAVVDDGHVVAEGTADQLKDQVGVRRLDLVVPDDADRAGIAAAAGGTDAGVETDGTTVRVPTSGDAADVRRLLDDLDPDARRISRFDVRTASLDDVFLALTGTTARTIDPSLQEDSRV